MHDDEIELRIELPKSELVILQAYKQGTGKSFKDVIRKLLAEWSDKKREEWIVGCRVAEINPDAPQSNRSGPGGH